MGYRQPYTEPALVLEVHGNKCCLKTKDGTILKDIHLEDVMLVPENARNLEKGDIEFLDEGEPVALDSIDLRRSPGMMLEDKGKSVEAQAKMISEGRKKISPGKLDRVNIGNFVVYALADKAEEVTVGKITSISRSEQTVVVHRYKPVTDGRLRLYWLPVFVENGAEVLGTDSVPLTETVPIKRLVYPTELHD